MQRIKRIISVFESINTHWTVFASYFILSIIVVILYEVVARYVFNAPTVWANSLGQMIFGGYIIMGGAYTLLHNGHVRVDVLYNHLPNDRVRAIVDVISSGFFFLFCFVMLYVAIPYVWEATLEDVRVKGYLWPAIFWPTLWCLPVATLLMTLQGIIKFARDLAIVITGRQEL